MTIPQVEVEARRKREKSGGFDKGLVLLKTGVSINPGSNALIEDDGRNMVHRGDNEIIEIPFALLVSTQVGAPNSAVFSEDQTIVEVRLKSDRLSLEMASIEDQPFLPGFDTD